MRLRLPAVVLAVPVLALSACGKSKDVNTANYTCAEFTKSLKTKGDDTAGNYINQLRKQANLGADAKAERQMITLGIYFSCRGKPGATKPADQAVVIAKKIKAGTYKLPGAKKKSSK